MTATTVRGALATTVVGLVVMVGFSIVAAVAGRPIVSGCLAVSACAWLLIGANMTATLHARSNPRRRVPESVLPQVPAYPPDGRTHYVRVTTSSGASYDKVVISRAGFVVRRGNRIWLPFDPATVTRIERDAQG